LAAALSVPEKSRNKSLNDPAQTLLSSAPRPRRVLNTLAPLAIYLALSLIFFGRNLDWTKFYFGYATDSVMFIWFLHWWPFALTHGLNPFICKYVWFPSGYNFAWATSVSFFALVSWPITALGGPVLSYNILMLSMPALAGWTAFLLARELTLDWVASLICGFMFGFSAPELSQLLAELNLDSVFLLPLGMLLGVRRIHGSISRRGFVVATSLLLVAQLGMSTEVLATLCIVSALTWIICLGFAPAAARGTYWRLALDVAYCVPLVIILAAPFLYYLVIGLPDFPTHIHWPELQQSDVLQFFVSHVPVHSAREAFDSIARQFAGFAPDNYVFASLPSLVILAWYFYRHSGTSYVRALGVWIGLMALLSLGLRLQVDGKLTVVPLPWALFSHVPVIRSVTPVRFLSYFSLGTAITAALFLAAARTPAARVRRYALAGLACLCLPPAKVQVLPAPWLTQKLFEQQHEFKWSLWPQQPFFNPAHVRAALPTAAGHLPNILLLPDAVVGPGMAWQLNAGMGFTQAEGYVGYTLVPEMKWTVLGETIFGPQPDFAQAFPVYCAAHQVDYILMGPGTPDTVVSAIEALGWPHHMDNGIEVVTVPKA
jgi:hypothetical protein